MDERLRDAIINNKVIALRRLLKRNIDVNKPDAERMYPILLAINILDEKYEIFYALLNHRYINLDVSDRYGQNVMHYAATYGLYDIINKLLNKGCHVNPCDDDNRTPLTLAINHFHYEVAELLVKRGSAIDVIDFRRAIEDIDNNNKLFKVLLYSMVRPMHDTYIYRLLVYAIKSVNYGAFEILCEYDLEAVKRVINYQDEKHFNHTLLYDVIYYNKNFDIIGRLIKLGADVNINTKSGGAPLHMAAHLNLFDVVKVLLDNGANKDLKNNGDHDAAYIAEISGHLDLAKYIRDYEGPPEIKEPEVDP